MTSVPLWRRQVRVLRVQRPSFSMRLDLRVLATVILLTLAALVVAWLALTTGPSAVSPSEVIAALRGRADASTSRIVLEWRLPRVVFALAGGAALAASGAVFQSLTRNPLGSPDVIGFSAGAYTGALLAALAGLSGSLAVPGAAMTGGILTGLAVYALAWRRGVTGLRIIVVGIGVSFFLTSVNAYLLTTMRLEEAIAVASWGAGDLGGVGWSHTVAVLAVLALCLPYLLARQHDMLLLEMGDDAARAVGVAGERLRIGLLIAAVALVSIVTAGAGPIAFVALAAPQLAMRLAGTSSVRVLPSAALGALLLMASDLVARTLLGTAQLPVGVVTLCLGGSYLVFLLTGLGQRRLGQRRLGRRRKEAR